ncbi:type II toxin-antitoxin system RelE/ParE family toxin [Streptomyces sp. CNQ-509]|uniref:type II toxin-antitoxin system RelE family toxin n=1 Tax=Streptomyces sp. CNQ-509 TaxID=444103 RepID=UPI000D14A2A8|nr:type II toxin-antitoxin system RelE/ParE family toxin [Streptomyces sp. CNQ-509]
MSCGRTRGRSRSRSPSPEPATGHASSSARRTRAPRGTGERRLRVGRYRATYRIDDGGVTVLVPHVGRGAA